jgi:uroporphyrin-3 C-methyltransferase
VVRFARSVLAGFDRTRDEIAAEASGAIGRTSVGAMVAATPVLLAPEQSVYLREQLKLRLLNARLALLAHEGEVFKGDIAAISDALPRFFAQEDAAVRAAIDYCRQLQALEISNERPELRSSLEALARLRNENRSGNSAAAAEVAP